MARARSPGLAIFVGPSLSPAEVRRLAPGAWVLPPARQGDVFRILPRRPRAIALIDGVFEAQPSVWHRELLAALDSGVAVFGASSMGALRAAELAAFGVIGVGAIFESYRTGRRVDDSDVALQHAGPEHDWRGFTVPLVTVEAVAAEARRTRRLTPAQTRSLLEAARALPYTGRTWRDLLDRVRLDDASRAELLAWVKKDAPDPKAEDARACIAAALAFARSGAQPPPGPGVPLSALVRGHRLREASAWVGDAEVRGRDVLAALEARTDAPEVAEAGLLRALVAGWARSMGLTASAAEIAVERKVWRSEVRATAATEEQSALAADDERALLEQRILVRKVLRHAPRVIADGPSWVEGLVAEARLRGIYADEARRLAARGSTPARKRPRSRR